MQTTDTTNLALTAQTARQVKEAIEAGTSDAAQADEALATAAQARADELIASIPALVREATKEAIRTHSSRMNRCGTSLMPIGVDDYNRWLFTQAIDLMSGTFVDPKELKHAARLVFEHCEQAGLNPYIARNKVGGEKYVTYSLNISWALPELHEVPRKKRWCFWRSAS